MAISGTKPLVHVSDSNGLPYVGAKLFIYEPGTTTLKSIYTDAGLTIAAPNPMTGVSGSNAAGNFPHFYIPAGNFKMRAETSAGVLIWEEDNLDTGLPAGSGALPIASGGTGGTTATDARTNLDVPSNSELADLASDIGDINATLQNIVSAPQGRLTPTTGVPVIATGVTAGTAVYYTPYMGNLLPIWDGLQFNTVAFAELTLTLNSNHTASNIYDVFVFQNSGVVTLATGPAWNTATAGAGARGTGAGTTELTRTKGGLWTNAFAMTARNGATTYAVDANKGTYVGSLFMDGTNGQISCHLAFGQSRKWGVWNAYNRMPIIMQGGDATSAWSYLTSAWRNSRNDANNTIAVFTGLAEEIFEIEFSQIAGTGDNNSTSNMSIAIGWNSSSSPSGKQGKHQTSLGIAGVFNQLKEMLAILIQAPAIGVNAVNALENGNAGTSGAFHGTSTEMLLMAKYKG